MEVESEDFEYSDASSSSDESDFDFEDFGFDENAELLSEPVDIDSNFAVSEGFGTEPQNYAELSIADEEFTPLPAAALFPGGLRFPFSKDIKYQVSLCCVLKWTTIPNKFEQIISEEHP
eukprot:TRINITY_DN4953_c0_g1_i1.p1 TRINITY_DN4953_c0_g1~~TRINITY_DN4953_c0_g1_i1.p1  ORF type:complete len:119 (+),score=13.56 TRINITY_DN4953_c0_g1_i1:272-628(+)